MAALVDLLLEGKITPDNLLSWLDGAHVDGVLEELSSLRAEFVPVFLNFLRDQSRNVVKDSVSTSGSSLVKGANSVRVTKYISPGKSSSCRPHPRRHGSLLKAKTLNFSDSPPKDVCGGGGSESHIPELSQLLRESDLSPSSPRHGCWTEYSNSCTSTPRHGKGYKESSRTPQHRGRKQGGDSEMKHSEQRLSLGDFLSPEVKMTNKKKSPLTRHVGGSPGLRSGTGMETNWTKNHHDSLPILDLSDQEAFPVVGVTPPPSGKQQKRRINPTRVTPSSSRRGGRGVVMGSRAVFGEPQSCAPTSPFLQQQENGTTTLEMERELLRQERLRRQGGETGVGERAGDVRSGDGHCNQDSQPLLPKATDKAPEMVEAILELVTKREIIDVLSRVYAKLLLHNMAPNIMVELYFLMQLLTVRVALGMELDKKPEEENGGESDLEIITRESYLATIHNCVYFAVQVLLLVWDLVSQLDRGTLQLLSEHPRVICFSTEFHGCLLSHLKTPFQPPVVLQAKSPIANVSFQTDTDTRNNFPSDQAFNIFRKQRDLFYEMLRIWEGSHLTPGWSFSYALGPRINQMLSFHSTPTNYAHFARLFQSQLLTMCTGDQACPFKQQDAEDLGFLTTLRVHQPGKYQRLYERLVTPSKFGGPCPAPTFPGAQDFFRAFLVTADSPAFNCHLRDVLTSEILIVSEQKLVISETEEGGPPDSLGRGEARAAVLRLRLLAKFLGLLEFLPYQTSERLPENVTAYQVALRSRVKPPINLCEVLRHSVQTRQLVVCIPWMVELLSMVDPVALHSRHYLTVIMALIAVFKLLYVSRPQIKQSVCISCSTFSSPSQPTFSPSSALFLKFALGWLFDLPNFPDGLFFAEPCEADIDQQEYNLTLATLSASYTRPCACCLRLTTAPHHDLLPTTIEDPLNTLGTPSKQKCHGYSMSPTKTPSKFLSVGMLASPLVTPNKSSDVEAITELSLSLDATDFVDHQMLTICCPFVSELKNLLSEWHVGQGGQGRSGNSYRKITPLSTPACSTSPNRTNKDLQLQLEDNFFHNQPSSVQKTTDFAAERISSNIIKMVRTQVLPKLRDSVHLQIRQLVDDQLQASPLLLSPISPGASDQAGGGQRDLTEQVERRVRELGQWMTGEVREKCTQLTQQHCSSEHVLPALSVLLPPDLPAKGMEVCRKVVSRMSQEKVVSWSQTHLTSAVFIKELTPDAEKIVRQAQKAAGLLNNSLQVSTTTTNNDSITSNPESSDAGAVALDTSLPPQPQTPLSPTDFVLTSPVHQMRAARRKVVPAIPTEVTVSPAKEHDVNTPSPSVVLTSIKLLLCDLTSTPASDLLSVVHEERVWMAVKDVRNTLTRRQDVTVAVLRALETLTIDLAVAVAVCLPAFMTSELQEAFVCLWKSRNDMGTEGNISMEGAEKCEAGSSGASENSGILPAPSSLGSLLCPRTVMLVAQNPSQEHQREAWCRLEEVTSLLLARHLLTPATLLDHCVPLLRHTWPQEILSGISSCIEGVSRRALGRPGCHDDPDLTQMLEWVGWVCRQMDDLGDDL
ncbi:hypothetical protein Pcinc_026922 [Petrolisthes cinctipes]|uniref:Codanin-1 C-terminal domain-containing protein n=1 Tax=Petrolisthes cinctipes TaxID=88211 RepID=A0AAE1KBK3_PETCI|nr:hypothetical protein Pcinc_026922 [Petrolisthes cinctipes]